MSGWQGGMFGKRVIAKVVHLASQSNKEASRSKSATLCSFHYHSLRLTSSLTYDVLTSCIIVISMMSLEVRKFNCDLELYLFYKYLDKKPLLFKKNSY